MFYIVMYMLMCGLEDEPERLCFTAKFVCQVDMGLAELANFVSTSYPLYN